MSTDKPVRGARQSGVRTVDGGTLHEPGSPQRRSMSLEGVAVASPGSPAGEKAVGDLATFAQAGVDLETQEVQKAV